MIPDRTANRRRVYLMRHAEVSYFSPTGEPVNPREVVLTERGRMQAQAMARLLADVPLDRAVCSGVQRARETAELILSGRELAILDEPEFREIKAGRLRDVPTGRRDEDLVYAFEKAARDGAAFAGGEPFAAFENRVVSAFQGLVCQPGWTRMMLVAHDGVNRVLLGWTARAGLSAMSAFEQDMACLNVLDFDVVDGAVVRSLVRLANFTPYDAAKRDLHLTSMEQVFDGYARPRPAGREGGAGPG
jgi:probable phosphoglycerate mutase